MDADAAELDGCRRRELDGCRRRELDSADAAPSLCPGPPLVGYARASFYPTGAVSAQPGEPTPARRIDLSTGGINDNASLVVGISRTTSRRRLVELVWQRALLDGRAAPARWGSAFFPALFQRTGTPCHVITPNVSAVFGWTRQLWRRFQVRVSLGRPVRVFFQFGTFSPASMTHWSWAPQPTARSRLDIRHGSSAW